MRLFEESESEEQRAWYALPGDLGWDVASPSARTLERGGSL